MENSVLNHITTNNICFYYEGWRNGKKGGFVQKDGIYRFHEKVRNKSGNFDDVYEKEEENPIVAIGIVAYWLIFNSRADDVIKRLTRYRVEIPKDMRELFENYTTIRFEQFKKEHRDDPNTWDWDWEYQFYAKVIIPHEMGFNKQSEALFDYISDSDIELVRAVMNNYIKYLEKCRTERGFHVSPELPQDVPQQEATTPQNELPEAPTRVVRTNAGSKTLKVFHANLDEAQIASTLLRMDTKGLGPKQFMLSAQDFFASIGWLTLPVVDTQFIGWMKARQVVSNASNNLQHVKRNKTMEDLKNGMRDTFQFRNANSKWEDKDLYYKKDYFGKTLQKINNGQ